jgi:Na+-driven multidrug efflux pump
MAFSSVLPLRGKCEMPLCCLFAVYLIAWWALTDQFGVQGLWGAMIIYIVARAMALLLFYPSLRRSVGV